MNERTPGERSVFERKSDWEPVQDVPPSLYKGLEEFVWAGPADEASTRVGVLSDLITDWDSLNPAEPPSDFASRLSSAELPPDVVDAFRQSLDSVDDVMRVWLALHHLVEEWIELAADHEKLVGHLMLRHGGLRGLAPEADEELAELHRESHQSPRSDPRPTL